MMIAESDSEPEEATVRVLRPRNTHRQDGVVSGGKSVTSAPQRGILKAKKPTAATTKTMDKLTKEERKKRVRFSLEGKSLTSNDVSDSSSNEEGGVVVEMESGDGSDKSVNNMITDSHNLGDILL